MQEGAGVEDSTLELIGLLNHGDKREALLEELRDSMYVTAPFSIVGDASLYNRRPRLENQFVPLALQEEASSEIADFVPKPLYTGRQLEEFRRRHTKNGVFQVLEDTVQSAEDLEKLLFIWQEATQSRQEEDRILLQEEIHQKDGFSYTGFSIDETENCYMFSYLEERTPAEVEAIRRTIQELLRQTCILQVKYDPVTLTARDNARYQVCLKHREFIADYLSVIGCELVHDPQDHLFRITGDGAAIEKMSLTTTKLLLLLKLIYRDKIMGEGLHATVTTLAEIREYGRNTGLLPGKLNAQDWQAALNLMKTHQMIELPGAILNVEDQTPIYIYGTVNIFCSSTAINELVQRYRDDAEEKTTEGEVASETGEEDLYPDVSE